MLVSVKGGVLSSPRLSLLQSCRQGAGIRALDGQRCKNLTMNAQGVLAICDELPTENSHGRRSAICERCRTNGGMAKDPFGSDKLIERKMY